jgi:hypothetical protein
LETQPSTKNRDREEAFKGDEDAKEIHGSCCLQIGLQIEKRVLMIKLKGTKQD